MSNIGMDNKGSMKAIGKVIQKACIVCLCIFIFSESRAQVDQIRIACIGNSITAGARVTNPEVDSYPALLSGLLQERGYANYAVRNFGIGGATVIRFGKPNLWQLLDSLENYSPDIVIVKVGTNETVGAPRYNWEHISDFEKDYFDYIGAIRKINPKCRFIICSPLDMVIKTVGLSPERINDLSLRRPRIWELRKRARKIANKEHANFLDLTKPFKDRVDLMTTSDGVHPNKDGYSYLATLVFDFMVKKKIVVR